MTAEDEGFVRRIVDGPGDDTPRLVYADWLDDHDDPRAAYLRAEAETPGHPRLAALAAGLDPVWAARVSRPPVGVCCDDRRFAGGRPVTRADIDRVSDRYNTRFAPAHVAFLLNYNGGRPDPAEFEIGGRVWVLTWFHDIRLANGRPAGDDESNDLWTPPLDRHFPPDLPPPDPPVPPPPAPRPAGFWARLRWRPPPPPPPDYPLPERVDWPTAPSLLSWEDTRMWSLRVRPRAVSLAHGSIYQGIHVLCSVTGECVLSYSNPPGVSGQFVPMPGPDALPRLLMLPTTDRRPDIVEE